MDVILIDYSQDPMEKLYGAYRTCYTQKTPREVWAEIDGPPGVVYPPEQQAERKDLIRKFVQERLKTGHVSPLEQVVFWFGISGVSRALSHQLVRHRIGISFEQQSQRYVKYKEEKGSFEEFVIPPTIQKNKDALDEFNLVMKRVGESYSALTKIGIPAEDARFVLPNAMPTNFQIMVNFAELLHICDLRLCHRAQWEIRRMVGLMRAEVRKHVPELAEVMQPKCGQHRMGYCDEDLKAYAACPLSNARPHKEDLFHYWQTAGNRIRTLTENDIQPEARCAVGCKGLSLGEGKFSGCSCPDGKLANGGAPPPGFICDCPNHPKTV
jgi:thymidylate synthase (FAD)